MKKLISILLVAVLVLGMFPATALTAFAAPTEETISFNSLSQRVSQTTTSQVWKSDNITFTNNKGSSSTNVANYSNPVRIYGKSDLIIECSAGKMTSILFVSNGGNDYKASLNSSLTAAGVTFSNSGNNYTVTFAEGVESFSFQNASTKQIRLHSMTVTYEAGGSTEPDVPECEHENTERVGYLAATCTTDGYTGDEVCLDCGETVNEGEVIPAGHTYVDGICSVCGEEEPAGYVEADVATLKKTDQVIVTVTTSSGVYALTNGNGTSAAPAATKVSVTDGTIAAEDVTDALIWNIVYSGGNIEIYPKDTTATWLYCTSTNNGVRVGTNTNKTFTIDATSGYLKHTSTNRYLGVYNSQDWRCYTSPTTNNIANQVLKFYKLSGGAAESCQHPNAQQQSDGYPAQCGVPGMTNSWYCPDCESTTVPQQTIPALEHNFVNGTCTNDGCGAKDPLYTLPGRYYIAATRSSGSYYMTSDLGTSSTKRYIAVETGLETLPTEITDPAFGYVFIVTRNEDGTFSIQAEGIPGDNYLGWSSGNSGILTADENIKFTATANEDGTFTFKNTAERYLSLNNSGDDWFAWYASEQKRDLTLIPVTGAETAPAATADGRYFATAEEAIAAAAEEGETVTLLAAAGNVEVTGDLVIDLNGNSIDSLTVSGTLKAYDSKATTTAASGAAIKKLTADAKKFIKDNTVNGVRYVTLDNNGVCSFHALDMQLAAVTLRTTTAGLYYKAVITCDDTLAAYINDNREKCSFGVVLSVNNMPGADFLTEEEDINRYTVAPKSLTSDYVFTSGILNNILTGAANDSARGKENVYANAYIKVGNDIYMADTTANDTSDEAGFDGIVFSLMTVMQALDTSYATMEDSNPHKALLLNFYTKWHNAMAGWGLSNLEADYVPPVTE